MVLPQAEHLEHSEKIVRELEKAGVPYTALPAGQWLHRETAKLPGVRLRRYQHPA